MGQSPSASFPWNRASTVSLVLSKCETISYRNLRCAAMHGCREEKNVIADHKVPDKIQEKSRLYISSEPQMIKANVSLHSFLIPADPWNKYGIFMDGMIRFYSVFGQADAGKGRQLRRILAARLQHKKKKEELL